RSGRCVARRRRRHASQITTGAAIAGDFGTGVRAISPAFGRRFGPDSFMRARDETPVFPPAEGQRIEWSALPLRIQSAIEERLGVPVVETATHAGGFSPGLASRVRTADSRDHFVKAVS